MSTLLDDLILTEELKDLGGWVIVSPEGQPVLANQFTFEDFKEAITFVNQVAEIAEDEFHHPDITISWNKVGLQITSHEAGGITDDCVTLASRIDALRSAD